MRHDALESVIHPSIITNRFGEIDADTIYEARMFIEMALVELAARKATIEEVERIWTALSEAHEVIADDEDFVSAEWDFHLAIAEAAHNELLQAFYHLARELLLDFIEDAISLPNIKDEATEYHASRLAGRRCFRYPVRFRFFLASRSDERGRQVLYRRYGRRSRTL